MTIGIERRAGDPPLGKYVRVRLAASSGCALFVHYVERTEKTDCWEGAGHERMARTTKKKEQARPRHSGIGRERRTESVVRIPRTATRSRARSNLLLDSTPTDRARLLCAAAILSQPRIKAFRRRRRRRFFCRVRGNYLITASIMHARALQSKLVHAFALYIGSYYCQLLLPALRISSWKSYCWQPEGLLTHVREVSGGEGPGPRGREFPGWRDWVGRVGGWW